MSPSHLPPSSTYRVQLSSSFTLKDLAAHVPYLAELGISDIYLSPIQSARPGSPHGYDIVDHGTIDEQLGGRDGWQALGDALRARSLGVVLDVVPNHMAADPVHNALWRQMLGEGATSPAARHFDVDWRPLTGLIRNKVLLPLLEEPYGAALVQGLVRLDRIDGEVAVRYRGLHLPLAGNSFDVALADQEIEDISADPQRMHAVLESQHYRLASWRAANDEINYRRFFDVNHLVAIRTEDEEVFERSHRLVLQLVEEGLVNGLRVDHVDGLLDPAGYLRRLRAAATAASDTFTWIVVEKILGRSETLATTWPVDGTTGYDALNVLNRLFVSARGVRMLRRFYKGLVSDHTGFSDVAYASKRAIMERTLRSGLTILSQALKRVADASLVTRDITLNAISGALVEFIACLPVYRTYLEGNGERPGDRDVVEQAFTRAIRRNPTLDLSALSFIRSLHLEPGDAHPGLCELRRAVVQQLQQYTSGVHAKGIEDTAFYRDNTLLTLNEVGGDPGGTPGTLDELHRFNEHRARHWPYASTATSTHDTKLGEDARIRIAALSIYAGEWIAAVRSWNRMNAPFRQPAGRGVELDTNTEYRVYQALVGVWPVEDCTGGHPGEPSLVERIASYMQKAAREAQVHTSWIRVNEEYEAALDRFVREVLTGESAAGFRCSLRSMVRRVMPVSVCHSISQLVLKCLMPGVPDIYQGSESWGLSLTDPDNRRPVDFANRLHVLMSFRDEDVVSRLGATSLQHALAGDVKPYVTTRLLRFRRDHRALMARARYMPIRARGERASAVVSFRRTFGREHVIVVVPRLVSRSRQMEVWPTGGFWEDTYLRVPAHVRVWSDVLGVKPVTLERTSRAPLAELTTVWPWLVLYGRE